MTDLEEKLKASLEIVPKQLTNAIQITMGDLHSAAVEYGRLQEKRPKFDINSGELNINRKEQEEFRKQIAGAFAELSNAAKAFYEVDKKLKKYFK